MEVEGAKAELRWGRCVGGARRVEAVEGGGASEVEVRGLGIWGLGREGGGMREDDDDDEEEGFEGGLRVPFGSGGGGISFVSEMGVCLGVVSGECGSAAPSPLREILTSWSGLVALSAAFFLLGASSLLGVICSSGGCFVDWRYV